MPDRKRPRILWILGAIVVATLVGAVASQFWPRSGRSLRSGSTGVAAIGGAFTLTDHRGVARTEADFRGRHMLVFFGYTHCPDFCPAGLAAMAEALDALGPAAEKIAPVFITIDPARDTVARLAEYVPQFHPRLVGLTGTAAQVAAAAKAWRVYFAKAPGDSQHGHGYAMEHSTYTYLMGPDGRYLTHFRHGTPPAEMAAKIREQM